MTTASDTNGGGGMPGSPPSKQSLVSWWKQFKSKSPRPVEKDSTKEKPGIFGVPLHQSIEYANVAISLTDAEGNSFIYGYVPIVVAKCGVFLKEKATDVEGIFRLSGSAKRIKDLQNIFNSPEKYGKGLDWTGYTVHDAANVLRRYLNQLPEPIIPLEFYDRFRAPLNLAPKQAIKVYQQLITELPPLNRQLLLYILDLLAVFASKSEVNLMTSQNLSAIFQPGLISHPSHDMSPEDYRISQDVLVFLIENQDHFLLGMRGSADEEASPLTSSMPNTPHSRNVSGNMISRSGSNASAAAEDVRKNGGIRRNVSVSSKRSTPGSPKVGVSRSNTLPSKRSPRLRPGSFKPTESSSSPTLGVTATTPTTTAPTQALGSKGQMTESVSPATPTNPSARKVEKQLVIPTERKSAAESLSTTPVTTPPAVTPSKERNIANLFLSGSDTERGKPNKLRKKRLPGSTNHSAESSTTSLPTNASSAPQTQTLEPVPQSPTKLPKTNENDTEKSSETGNETGSNTHINFLPQVPPSVVNSLTQPNPSQSATSSGTALSAISPSHSVSSSLSSEHETQSSETVTESVRKRRPRWRISVGKIENPPLSPPLGPMPKPPHTADATRSKSLSSSPKRDLSRERERDRREGNGSDGAGSGEDSKGARGAFGWLQKKMSERSERRHKAAADDVADSLGHQAHQPPAPAPQALPSSTSVPSPIQVPRPSLQLPNRKGDAVAGDGRHDLAIGQAR